MSAILYIETNYFISFATGRDRATNDLLLTVPPAPRRVIPAVCFMEAFVTFESIKRESGRFIADLGRQIQEYSRGVVWADRDSRLGPLRQSRVEIDTMFDQFRERLLLAVETLNELGEKINLTREILRDAVGRSLIKDTTDNLILASILSHARSHPSELKAFLTENHKDFEVPEALQALRDAGVKYFRKAEECRNWLGALAPPPPS